MTIGPGGADCKVILIDVETMPQKVFTWAGKYELNVMHYIEHSFLYSFAWKELGAKDTDVITIDKVPNDKRLCARIREILHDADIVIAHNGRAFDLPTIMSRLAFHKIKPPHFVQIDTLKMARQFFRFPSNSLDDLADFLGVGRKLPHTGKDLWLRCYDGDPKAVALMKRYNQHDVVLLERVYDRLKPFAANHPRIDYFTRNEACPTCQSTKTIKDGFSYVASGKRQLMECQSCGAHWKVGKLIK